MKKKIFSIFLVMVLCIGMTAGCKKNVGTSQDNAIAEEDDDSKEEAKSYRFGFSCITMENPYYITLEQALREAVEAQGSTLVTKDPALNVDTQIEQIHQMIKDGLDAIFRVRYQEMRSHLLWKSLRKPMLRSSILIRKLRIRIILMPILVRIIKLPDSFVEKI